jgi:predicted RNA binding protein YcfA (HicA-like mRNA interferase family)
MTDDAGRLLHLLRNVPVRELVAALRRDGFVLERQTRTGARIYGHDDGRLTVIHYHSGSDILTRKTLSSILQSTRWGEADLRRLKLIK